MKDGYCTKHGCYEGMKLDGDSMLRRCFILSLILVLLLSAGVSMASDERNDLFQSCVEKSNAYPINVVWLGNLDWVQSTVHPAMISSLLALRGESVDWNSETGVAYPDLQKAYGVNTIGMTLSDGSIVRFIIDGEANGRFYGWLTDSTQFYGADYNPQPQPHVRCGFWSVSVDDVFNLYDVFISLTRHDRFNYDAR